jgi:hypothetical protein
VVKNPIRIRAIRVIRGENDANPGNLLRIPLIIADKNWIQGFCLTHFSPKNGAAIFF